MRNAGLDELQAGIKIARKSINNLRYAEDTSLMAESEEELKSLLMKVKEESVKPGLNSTFRKQSSGQPIYTSWQIGGKNGNSERLYYYYFLAPNSLQMVTSHEIIRHLLLGRKTMTNLDSILKNRDKQRFI